MFVGICICQTKPRSTNNLLGSAKSAYSALAELVVGDVLDGPESVTKIAAEIAAEIAVGPMPHATQRPYKATQTLIYILAATRRRST